MWQGNNDQDENEELLDKIKSVAAPASFMNFSFMIIVSVVHIT